MKNKKLEQPNFDYEAHTDQPEELQRAIGKLAVTSDVLSLDYLEAQLKDSHDFAV